DQVSLWKRRQSHNPVLLPFQAKHWVDKACSQDADYETCSSQVEKRQYDWPVFKELFQRLQPPGEPADVRDVYNEQSEKDDKLRRLFRVSPECSGIFGYKRTQRRREYSQKAVKNREG